MQRERFGYKQGIIGCEWAIIAPIVVSLLFALIGVIYCNANGLQADALNSNAVFMTLASAFTELSFLVVALCIAWRSKTNFVAGAGLKVRTPWWTYIGAAVLSAVVLLLLNPIINCWQTLLQSAGHNDGSLPFAMDNAGSLILGLVLFALLPAVCEEALFRGVILNSLRKYGLVVSVGLSSLFFSLMHMNLLQIPYTLLLGIVLGLVVYFTRNLWLSVIMHFVNNGMVLIIGYFSAEEYNFVWYDVLWGVGGLILFAGLVYLLYILLKKCFGNKTDEIERPMYEAEPTLDKKTRMKMWIAPLFVGIACLVISILGGFGVI